MELNASDTYAQLPQKEGRQQETVTSISVINQPELIDPYLI